MKKFLIALMVFTAAAFGYSEITKVNDSNGFSTYYSTELKKHNILVINNVEEARRFNTLWEEIIVEDRPQNVVVTERTSHPNASEVTGDILKLLDITGAVYMDRDYRDGKVWTKIWRNEKGEIYIREVMWKTTNQTE